MASEIAKNHLEAIHCMSGTDVQSTTAFMSCASTGLQRERTQTLGIFRGFHWPQVHMGRCALLKDIYYVFNFIDYLCLLVSCHLWHLKKFLVILSMVLLQ